MKSTNRLLSLTLILLLFVTFSYSQETHVVTLYVNTAELTKNSISEHANFGQTDGVTNEDFTTFVYVNDNVEWIGVSTSSEEDEVNITKIKYKKGKKLLQRDENDGVKKVMAKVDKGDSGDEEKYILYFNIVSQTNPQNRTFIIDPKIQIKTQE
ncbi:hypothetical protein [Namhaeicola litoreus]|uniref:Uncharacterized protein n=1 Tax=Namhaeicola litoreus TaxID=1052145 RepID=A0ABW3XZY0_9FLAO